MRCWSVCGAGCEVVSAAASEPAGNKVAPMPAPITRLLHVILHLHLLAFCSSTCVLRSSRTFRWAPRRATTGDSACQHSRVTRSRQRDRADNRGKNVPSACAPSASRTNLVVAVTGIVPATNALNGNRMSSIEAELKGLMIATLGGDERAYRELLGRMSRLLRGYYKTKLAARGAADAEDLVQETLMALHARRDTYDAAQPFTPWLYAIARYKLIDYYRRTRSSAANVSIDDVQEIVAHDDQAASESSLDLDRLLDGLPSKFQTAIRHVKLEGLSVAETAAREGLSESAVKVNVHRGMKVLAALVAKGRRS